jgi:hypothetical protein
MTDQRTALHTPRSASRGPRKPTEEIAPSLPAGHPRLLVCRSEPRFSKPNRAPRTGFATRIRLVDLRQDALFLECSCIRITNVARTEQPFSQTLFHWCALWLFGWADASVRIENDLSRRPAVETAEGVTSAFCIGGGVANSAGMLPRPEANRCAGWWGVPRVRIQCKNLT